MLAGGGSCGGVSGGFEDVVCEAGVRTPVAAREAEGVCEGMISSLMS
jgi:hypothetical protein